MDQRTDTIDLSDLRERDDLLRGCIGLRVPFAVLPSPENASHPGYTVYVPDPLPPGITFGQLWGFVRTGITRRAHLELADEAAVD